MNYRLLSVAEAELAQAAEWYETQAPGLGEEFLDEFEAVMKRIIAWVPAGARRREKLRAQFCATSERLAVAVGTS